MTTNDFPSPSNTNVDATTDRGSDSLIVEAMAEYRRLLDTGSTPDRDSFLTRYSQSLRRTSCVPGQLGVCAHGSSAVFIGKKRFIRYECFASRDFCPAW